MYVCIYSFIFVCALAWMNVHVLLHTHASTYIHVCVCNILIKLEISRQKVVSNKI